MTARCRTSRDWTALALGAAVSLAVLAAPAQTWGKPPLDSDPSEQPAPLVVELEVVDIQHDTMIDTYDDHCVSWDTVVATVSHPTERAGAKLHVMFNAPPAPWNQVGVRLRVALDGDPWVETGTDEATVFDGRVEVVAIIDPAAP